MRELTVFFSDIEGFTGISEKMPPEKLVAFLNRYLGAMTDIILESGGTLDKYEGDAIIAFWGAPLPLENHARSACLAAIDNQKKLAELCKVFADEAFLKSTVASEYRAARWLSGIWALSRGLTIP